MDHIFYSWTYTSHRNCIDVSLDFIDIDVKISIQYIKQLQQVISYIKEHIGSSFHMRSAEQVYGTLASKKGAPKIIPPWLPFVMYMPNIVKTVYLNKQY